MHRDWMAGVCALIAVVACAALGCSEPAMVVDAGVDAAIVDAGASRDSGVDAGSGEDAGGGGDDAGRGDDAGVVVDAGPPTTAHHGSIATVAGASIGGTTVVVDQGFEVGGRVCSGTTCVVGGILP